MLDGVRVQYVKSGCPQFRLKVVFDDTPICFLSPWFDTDQVILFPGRKPLPNCQLTRLLENTLSDLCRDLRELLGNLGLGLPGDGVLLLLSLLLTAGGSGGWKRGGHMTKLPHHRL